MARVWFAYGFAHDAPRPDLKPCNRRGIRLCVSGDAFFIDLLFPYGAVSIQVKLSRATASPWVAKLGVDTMANGTVKWFNATKGFGFIAPANGNRDVFVHVSALERAGIRQLNDGQAVTFDIESGRDGRESATNLALA